MGTRRSALATRQTELVLAALRARRPEARFEVVLISTEGDERPDVSLRALGGTGAFVKRIERALIAGEIDLAVHSLKDVPTELEPGLVLAAIPERGDPRDALVVPAASGPELASPACGLSDVARERLPELAYGARIGTGSARRAAQLLALRDDLELLDVRGNVDTRLRKLDGGEFDALVLAAAGLSRLERSSRATRLLTPEECLPMVGQGALAIEARVSDREAVAVAGTIEDGTTRVCVDAERAFLSALGGGCALPVGAMAVVDGGELWLRVALGDASGRSVSRRDGRVPVERAGELAERLADKMMAAVGGR